MIEELGLDIDVFCLVQLNPSKSCEGGRVRFGLLTSEFASAVLERFCRSGRAAYQKAVPVEVSDEIYHRTKVKHCGLKRVDITPSLGPFVLRKMVCATTFSLWKER